MAADAIAAEFSKLEELQRHVSYYQSEIATAVGRLQQLLAQRDSFSQQLQTSETNTTPMQKYGTYSLPNQMAHTTQKRSFHQGKRKGETAVLPRQLKAELQSPAKSKRLRCPHVDCRSKRKGYTRKQDVVRHYALHLDVLEFCQFCDATLQAHQYMIHSCIKTGPDNQRQYTEMKVTALRKLAQHELQKWPPLHDSPGQSSRTKIQQPVERFDTATITTVSTRNPSLEKAPEIVRAERNGAALLRSMPTVELGPSPATSLDAQFPEHPIAFPANPETFPSNFQFGPRPLFAPLDMAGQYQLQSSQPLWSTTPPDMHKVSWSSDNVPLGLADNTAPGQHVDTTLPEQQFES